MAIILMFTLIFSSTAAANSKPALTVVSLGDSITFGWNLEPTQTPPVQSNNAFPFLIGNGNTEVLNVSYPGWTSTQLLDAVKSDEAKQMLQQADVVTLNIGANDLLQAVEIQKIIESQQPADPAELEQKVTFASAQIYSNVTSIIDIVQAQTNAPILLYSLYNPFGLSENPTSAYIHTLGELITNGSDSTPGVNQSIFEVIAAQKGIVYLDAYSAFNGKQNNYIIPGDIHPTLLGQQALAKLATDKLTELTPIKIDPSLSTEEETSEPITISLAENQDIVEAKWLEGEKSIEDFVNAGTQIENLSFSVTTNGFYTIYVKTTINESVQTIQVSNIVPKVEQPEEEEPPVDEELEEPPGEENENAPPTKENPPVKVPEEDKEEVKEVKDPVQQPSKEVETKEPKVEKPKPQMVKSGHALPNTATSMYNTLMGGLFIFGIGSGIFLTQRIRKSKNEHIDI